MRITVGQFAVKSNAIEQNYLAMKALIKQAQSDDYDVSPNSLSKKYNPNSYNSEIMSVINENNIEEINRIINNYIMKVLEIMCNQQTANSGDVILYSSGLTYDSNKLNTA